MFPVSSCSCLCPIQVLLSPEWRCSWSSADRLCSNYIWVINNFIAYLGAVYIRGLAVDAMATRLQQLAVVFAQSVVKFIIVQHFQSRKCIWKCRLQTVSRLIPVTMRLVWICQGNIFHSHRAWNQTAVPQSFFLPLQWLYNGHDSVSNHQPHDCLLTRLFRRRPKKTSKLLVTGLCAGYSPVTGEFLAQMASNAENVSIWWRHHAKCHRCHRLTLVMYWMFTEGAKRICYSQLSFLEREMAQAIEILPRGRKRPVYPMPSNFLI